MFHFLYAKELEINSLLQKVPNTPLASMLLQIILTRCNVIKGAQYLVAKAGSADKELRTFEGYYHDLIREQGKEQVYEEIFGWLLQRTTLTNNNIKAPESLPAEPTATIEQFNSLNV